MIPKKLLNKINKASKTAIIHRALIEEIDKEMESLGYDIDRIREDDACGYVDTIDYGRPGLYMHEFAKYKLDSFSKNEE